MIRGGRKCSKGLNWGDSSVWATFWEERHRSPREMAGEAALRLRGSKEAVIIQYASWCVNNDYWLVLCMDYVLNTEKWVENKILDGKMVKDFAHRPSNSWVLRCCFWNLESADESWKMESGVAFTTTDQEPSPGISPDQVPGLVSQWKRLGCRCWKRKDVVFVWVDGEADLKLLKLEGNFRWWCT